MMNRRGRALFVAVLQVIWIGCRTGADAGGLLDRLLAGRRKSAPSHHADGSRQAGGGFEKEVRTLIKGLLNGPDRITYAEEREYGEIVTARAIRMLGGKLLPPDRHRALWSYVGTIASLLGRCSIRPKLPSWKVGIVDSPQINACSAPGGYILVTTGLLRACRDEAELAGVLAHEIAHVGRRHGLYIMYKQMKPRMYLAGFSLLSRGRFDMDRAYAAVGKALEDYMEFRYGTEKEYEADRLGAENMWRLGYDPRALVSFISRLPRAESSAYRNHPSNESRCERLARFIEAEYGANPGGVRNRERLAEYVRALESR